MLIDKGLKAVVVMWVMTGLSFIFVPLRLYTRLFVVKALGLDDHVYNLGWVFLFLYTVFVTIAGIHGFGQPISHLATEEAVVAVFWEMVGQTFAVLGMAIAKISLGIFLLRIVVKMWHRVTIWLAMVSLAIVSMMTAIIFWVQKIPSHGIWDPRIPSRTVVSVTPFSVLLGAWCAAVDFYFAVLPWIFIWKLNMKTKEKLTIAISLSLGFIAFACGIIRTVDLGGLSSTNYTEDTVGLIIWSAVELAVTLICVGIPTIRPLYRRLVHGSKYKVSDDGYRRQEESNETPSSQSYRMRKFSSRFGARADEKGTTTSTITGMMNGRFDVDRGIGIPGSFASRSDEEMMLRSQSQRQSGEQQPQQGIQVREEVRVDRF